MSALRNIALLILSVGLFVGSYFILSKGPCDSPITYRIGTFDAKFGVSKQVFLKDIAQAAAIWEKAAGKPLFKYDASGEMPVNLLYDSRQAMVDTTKTLAASVDRTVATADSVKADLERLRAEYRSADAEYKSLAARYDATPDTAKAEALRLQVNAKATETNDLARQVNGLVDTYNSLVRSANVDVRTINQSAGKEFEQGEYIYDSKGQRINVYEFDGTSKLVRLLAHELGHATGMGHNDDPQSIMYYLNQGTSLVPSAEDVAALKSACKLGV